MLEHTIKKASNVWLLGNETIAQDLDRVELWDTVSFAQTVLCRISTSCVEWAAEEMKAFLPIWPGGIGNTVPYSKQ